MSGHVQVGFYTLKAPALCLSAKINMVFWPIHSRVTELLPAFFFFSPQILMNVKTIQISVMVGSVPISQGNIAASVTMGLWFL